MDSSEKKEIIKVAMVLSAIETKPRKNAKENFE